MSIHNICIKESKAPWSWGRAHSFGRAQDRIPSPITKEREKQREKSKLEMKRKKKHARKRPVTRERARTRRLDPKLVSVKKRLDSNDVMWIKRPSTHEA